MVWTPGQVLRDGKYVIKKKLGDGGFGITYLAEDKKGNTVVIKTLKETDREHPDFDKYQQDFVNEALRLKGCQHPHIVKVYESIKEGELWGMVMEYIEGEDIGSLGKLPESEALRYIRQIGAALAVVHDNGLLHRDVNPKNIMIRAAKSEAVLIDFGIAPEFSPDISQTHTVYLTPFYAPSEQYNPRARRGAFTDIYGLAATLYKLLTGQEPEASVSRAIGCPLAPPQQLDSRISNIVNQAILKGLELNPENRPQSMQEWLRLFPDYLTPNPSPARRGELDSGEGREQEIRWDDEPIPALYHRLRDLLKTGNWTEADEETARVMLQVAGREEEGWLNLESIKSFPSEDLRAIDRLWVKFSNGRFGFSVQKRIWQEVGGKVDYETECRLGERIGWRIDGEWQNYDDFIFCADAPVGYLPGRVKVEFCGGLLFSRVEMCEV
jgi:serine/threonine protein kinase